MDLHLSGRVALVTGAGRGLGRAIALALAEEGATVVGTARGEAALQSVGDLHPAVHALELDARDPAAPAVVVEAALELTGHLDIVVNNAAVAPTGLLLEQDPGLVLDALQVNLLSPIALVRAALPAFRARGGGKVVNVASIAALRAQPTVAAYSASKAGLLRITEALASELATDHVQVNALALGAFATEMQGVLLEDPERYAKRVRRIPAGRMGAPAEVGPLVCYLASPISDFVTGATFVIDGGESARI